MSEEALEKQGSKAWMHRSESLGERKKRERKDTSFCRKRERKEKLQLKKKDNRLFDKL